MTPWSFYEKNLKQSLQISTIFYLKINLNYLHHRNILINKVAILT